MKRTATTAIALAASVALLVPGGALGASKTTYRQSGQIVGDKGSEIKLRVEVKRGEPRQIKGFKANDVITRCDDAIRRIDYRALSPIPLHGGQFNMTLTDSDINLKIKLKGKVKSHGKAVRGKISTNRFEAGKDTCKASKQKFRTSI